MIKTLTENETAKEVKGPAGKIETVVGEPIGLDRNAVGVVCHPHPLHGGTMTNKVVTTLCKSFQQLGVTTVRFNFRGVGDSQGEYDFGKGEVDDLIAVVNWLQQETGSKELWLGGFSFGAFIAASGAVKLPAKKLVTVAPPVMHFPMRELPPIMCDWVLVQGDQDEVVPPEEVYAWAEGRQPAPNVIKLPEAGHFFHGQLGLLRTEVEQALTN